MRPSRDGGTRSPWGPQSAGPTLGLSLRSLPPAGGQWYDSQGCPWPPLGMTQPPPVLLLRPEHGRSHQSHPHRKTCSPGCGDQTYRFTDSPTVRCMIRWVCIDGLCAITASVSKRSRHPKEDPHPLPVSLQPLATVRLLCVSTDLQILSISYKRDPKCLGFCVWLPSLRVMSSGFIHVVLIAFIQTSFRFMAKYYFIVWL